MLFNLDKNLKHSILEEYRKEALLHKEKKQLQKQQKIKEELEYLEEINKKDEETIQKLKQEEAIKKDNQRKYYEGILNSPDKNSRKKELIIKLWENNDNKSTPSKEDNIFRKDSNNNKYEIDYNNLSPLQRQKIYIRKSDDHMDKYLTDEQNNNELSKYLKEEKSYRQKYYKDLVNSQYEEAQRINKDRYGTNDILIIENKRKKYFNENNYPSNKKYDFGKSNLLHNPIVNPENNLGYNKYINFRLNRSNIFKNTLDYNNINNNDINELNNNQNPLFNTNEEDTHNRRILKINDNNNYNNLNKNKNVGNKLVCKTELNLLENNNNSNSGMKLNMNNNYGRYSDKNIFDYKKKINELNSNNSYKNIYETNNNYDYKNNNQSSGSILSQAAKSNFLI